MCLSVAVKQAVGVSDIRYSAEINEAGSCYSYTWGPPVAGFRPLACVESAFGWIIIQSLRYDSADVRDVSQDRTLRETSIRLIYEHLFRVWVSLCLTWKFVKPATQGLNCLEWKTFLITRLGNELSHIIGKHRLRKTCSFNISRYYGNINLCLNIRPTLPETFISSESTANTSTRYISV